MSRTFIVSATYEQARTEARERGLGPLDWTFVGDKVDARKMLGTVNPTVIYAGTPPQDLSYIEGVAKRRARGQAG